MRFNKVIFWCEFPNEVDWEIFNKIFKIKSDIYIASKTKKEFLKWKSKIKNEYVKKGEKTIKQFVTRMCNRFNLN